VVVVEFIEKNYKCNGISMFLIETCGFLIIVYIPVFIVMEG
jgi:hypothetical protein